MQGAKSMKQKAFTLIEVLVVVGIIGILASMGVTSYTRALRNGRDARRKSDMRDVAAALEQYWAEHDGQLPKQGAGQNAKAAFDSVVSKLRSGTTGGYLKVDVKPIGDGDQYPYYYWAFDSQGKHSMTYVLCAKVELETNANSSSNCQGVENCTLSPVGEVAACKSNINQCFFCVKGV